MGSDKVDKIVEALVFTLKHIGDFLQLYQRHLGEVTFSSHQLMIFCSFLTEACYSPWKDFFPDSIIKRTTLPLYEFRQIVIDTIVDNYMKQYQDAVDDIFDNNDDNMQWTRSKMTTQTVSLMQSKFLEYYKCYQQDLDKLSKDQDILFPYLSEAFMINVMLKRDTIKVDHTTLTIPTFICGICITCLTSQLMNYFNAV